MSCKVLIIEDDPSNLKILEVTLKNMDCDILTAKNGEEGFRKAVECNPKLILLDVMMPKMSGLDFLKKLRENISFGKIPVFIISAKTGELDEKRALDAGANEFISKPFRVKEIQNIVKKYINGGNNIK